MCVSVCSVGCRHACAVFSVDGWCDYLTVLSSFWVFSGSLMGCCECDVFFCFSITETISESLESLDAGEIRVCVCVCVCARLCMHVSESLYFSCPPSRDLPLLNKKNSLLFFNNDNNRKDQVQCISFLSPRREFLSLVCFIHCAVWWYWERSACPVFSSECKLCAVRFGVHTFEDCVVCSYFNSTGCMHIYIYKYIYIHTHCTWVQWWVLCALGLCWV